MKILVLGGTSGIGKLLVKHYSAVGIGKTNGYSYPESAEKIKELSFDFEIIINCLPDENQLFLLEDLVNSHNERNLQTYFISIGSMSYKINDSSHFKNRLFVYNEELLLKEKTIMHTLINPSEMFNSKNDRFFERISQDDFLSVIDFLITTTNKNLNVHLIELNGKLIKR